MKNFLQCLCLLLVSLIVLAENNPVFSTKNTLLRIYSPFETHYSAQSNLKSTHKPANKTKMPSKQRKISAVKKNPKIFGAKQKVVTTQTSILEKRFKEEQHIASTSFGIVFYKPTYILPAYYTASPYYAIYENNTPDNQRVKRLEFKGQLSIKVPLLKNLIRFGQLYLGYTQLSYWQIYASSQYFRETDYEPELFLTKRITRNLFFTGGIVHQSNGRGGTYERSWNRAYLDFTFSGARWLISLKPWILIFKSRSSSLHNSDIDHYLGYGRLLMAYEYHHVVFSLKLHNMIITAFGRGSVEGDISFPIYGYIHGYIQAFDGYGQSLIEYNHRTKAIGVGISLNDWI